MKKVQIFYKDKLIESFNYDFIEMPNDDTNSNVLFKGDYRNDYENRKIVAIVPKEYLLIFNDKEE